MMITSPSRITAAGLAAAATISLGACTADDPAARGAASPQTPATSTPTPTPVSTGASSATPAPSPSPTGPATATTAPPMDAQSWPPATTGAPITPTSNPDRATATPTRTPLPPGKQGTPRGQQTSLHHPVDRSNADQVAAAWGQLLELWDCRLDRRPNDASRRAVKYATQQLRGKMLSGSPVAPPGHRWNQLCAHDGWTTTKARLGGLGAPPADTPDEAWRAVQITTTDHGANGWQGETTSTLYVVHLTRDTKEQPWQVASYRIR